MPYTAIKIMHIPLPPLLPSSRSHAQNSLAPSPYTYALSNAQSSRSTYVFRLCTIYLIPFLVVYAANHAQFLRSPSLVEYPINHAQFIRSLSKK